MLYCIHIRIHKGVGHVRNRNTFKIIYLYCLFIFVDSDIFAQPFWQKAVETKDEELYKLAERMKKTILVSRAPSTVTTYLRALKRWKAFTLQHPTIQYFPAQANHVALYLQHLLDTTGSYHSIELAFYTLKWAHKTAGVADPTDSPIVSLLREGAKRILGTAKINRKEPLSTDQLNEMISRANLENTLDLRNVCMYSIAFAGLLRFDDLIRIRRCDLHFHTGFLKINIAKSKNDQLRKGNEVLIKETHSSSSPVKLLKLYLEQTEIPADCQKYIFRPLVKTKTRHRLISEDRHISYTTFREGFKSHLGGIVDDTTIYSSHSLRSGGATKAANSGLNERLIQRHGRWKSAKSKNMYIDDSVTNKLEISSVILD